MTYTQSLLRDELIRDEGCKATVYTDTEGHLSIGIGVNLDAGLYPEEIDFLLKNRIRIAESDLDRNVPWWRSLSDARQRSLINMCFNLGWAKLSQFKNMLAHLQAGNYDQAADDATHSVWSSQVGARSQRIAKLIREG
jgi:lysozyme